MALRCRPAKAAAVDFQLSHLAAGDGGGADIDSHRSLVGDVLPARLCSGGGGGVTACGADTTALYQSVSGGGGGGGILILHSVSDCHE